MLILKIIFSSHQRHSWPIPGKKTPQIHQGEHHVQRNGWRAKGSKKPFQGRQLVRMERNAVRHTVLGQVVFITGIRKAERWCSFGHISITKLMPRTVARKSM